MNKFNFEEQFGWDKEFLLRKIDFLNWFRYFAILKQLIDIKPKRILEIGAGEETIKNIFEKFAEKYETMDINEKLEPDYVGKIQELNNQLFNKFDCIVAADVLEHIPFGDLEKALSNLYAYLKAGGSALITIPHRASYFLLMFPTYKLKVIRIPTGFLSPKSFYRRFIKRKIWIDPYHEWEIGDGKHFIKDVEGVIKKAGFKIEKREKLLYVDFWVLKK